MSFDSDRVLDTIKYLKNGTDGIESQITDMCVYLNGGVTFFEAKTMSARERNLIMDKINAKNTAQSGQEWM